MAILTGDLTWKYVEAVNNLSGDVTITAADIGAYGADNINEALVPIVDVSGIAYTTILSDRGSLLVCSNASPVGCTIPPESEVAYPIGTVISFMQQGAGQVSLIAGSGVNLLSENGLNINAQDGLATAIKIASDTWSVSGSMAA